MTMTRRHLLTASIAGSAMALAGCASTTNPTTGTTSYGLDPAVVATIQNVVNAVASYTPAIESIASVAAGLFGPGYTAIVTAGSAAINALETALENLVTSLPVGAKLAHKRYGASPSGILKGYVKTANGYVPVFAQ